MIKDTFFSLPRFMNLCRKEMVENWRSNVLRMVLMYGVMACLLYTSTTNQGAFCFGYFAKFLFFDLSMVLWYTCISSFTTLFYLSLIHIFYSLYSACPFYNLLFKYYLITSLAWLDFIIVWCFLRLVVDSFFTACFVAVHANYYGFVEE